MCFFHALFAKAVVSICSLANLISRALPDGTFYFFWGRFAFWLRFFFFFFPSFFVFFVFFFFFNFNFKMSFLDLRIAQIFSPKNYATVLTSMPFFFFLLFVSSNNMGSWHIHCTDTIEFWSQTKQFVQWSQQVWDALLFLSQNWEIASNNF